MNTLLLRGSFSSLKLSRSTPTTHHHKLLQHTNNITKTKRITTNSITHQKRKRNGIQPNINTSSSTRLAFLLNYANPTRFPSPCSASSSSFPSYFPIQSASFQRCYVSLGRTREQKYNNKGGGKEGFRRSQQHRRYYASSSSSETKDGFFQLFFKKFKRVTMRSAPGWVRMCL